MARDVGGKASGGASGARRQSTDAVGLGPRGSLLMSLALALLLGALSGLVMFSAAQHLRSLRDGVRAEATLHTSGACMAGRCRVEFEAGGRTVVADLPVGSGGGKWSVGTSLSVRYQADDPQVVARDEDVGGGGAVVLAVMSGGAALLFLTVAVVAALFLAWRRHADPMAGRTPQEGQRHGGRA